MLYQYDANQPPSAKSSVLNEHCSVSPGVNSTECNKPLAVLFASNQIDFEQQQQLTVRCHGLQETAKATATECGEVCELSIKMSQPSNTWPMSYRAATCLLFMPSGVCHGRKLTPSLHCCGLRRYVFLAV